MIKEDNDLEPKKLIHEPLVCFVRSIGLFSNLDYYVFSYGFKFIKYNNKIRLQESEKLRDLNDIQNQEDEPNLIPAYDLLDVVEKIEQLGQLKQANAKLQENDVGNKKLNIPFSNDAINRSKLIIFLLYYTTIFYPEGLEAMIILTLLI